MTKLNGQVLKISPCLRSAIRCVRNEQDAIALIHSKDSIILTPEEVDRLKDLGSTQVPTVLQDIVQNRGSNSQLAKAWSEDETIGWDLVSEDAGRPLACPQWWEQPKIWFMVS